MDFIKNLLVCRCEEFIFAMSKPTQKDNITMLF